MKVWFLCVWLIIPAAHSHSDGAVPQKQPKCKNPKGNLRSSLLDKDCGVSVCKKKGKNAVWEKCPRPATQDKLQEMEKTMLSATEDKLQEMEKTILSATEDKLQEMEKTILSATEEKLQEMEKTMLSAFKTLEEKIDDQFGSRVCPPTWPTFKNNCYKLFTTPVTWDDAKTLCQQENSHLASINSAEEHQFIVERFVRGKDKSDYIWVGGNDQNQEGNWVWTDGSHWNYTDWNPGQPDNYNNNAAQGEHCLNLFSARRSGKFNDWFCSYKMKFLCKIKY